MNLNRRSCAILGDVVDEYGPGMDEYRTDYGIAYVLDLGVHGDYPLEAGIRVAEACMGSLAYIGVDGNKIKVDVPEKPAIATMSCQMAAWFVTVSGMQALGSGPANILAKSPNSIVKEVGYLEKSSKACFILETEHLPSRETCEEILENTCATELYLAAFKCKSNVGLINVMARIVEVGMFRLHNLGYDINQVEKAEGECMMPEMDEEIMFNSNDAIIYKGEVKMNVKKWIPGLEKQAVSMNSRLYGKRFRELFNKAGGDFYQIDPEIFAPAVLEVRDESTGREYAAGRLEDIK
ncbi:MAG: methenyltetrahydromethanopterin cyclohydrolase [Candidatus Altiarchaeota archaeon]|nr:methenyltetrahydromethanopterin cyclohydrolase [Candidatus Altiarchaeota archaeon]